MNTAKTKNVALVLELSTTASVFTVQVLPMIVLH
jgi:hypothetical protein